MILEPESGYTETLPWGAVRVAGRNRQDTLGNPSVYSVSVKFITPEDIAAFDNFWAAAGAEGSVPIETTLGWAQIMGAPSYTDNTGRRATVGMRWEILPDVDYCLDESVLVLGEYFGDAFPRVAKLLESAVENGS